MLIIYVFQSYLLDSDHHKYHLQLGSLEIKGEDYAHFIKLEKNITIPLKITDAVATLTNYY